MTRLDPAFLAQPLAHRGLHGAACAENSLEAFDAAVAAGYGIELDVQGTRDGHAVVFHDATLDRMTDETGRVRERTLDEMLAIPLKGGSSIIELGDLIRRVDGRVPVLIEIKDQSGTLGDTDGQLERAVAKAAQGAARVAVMSFNPASVQWMRRHAPDLARGLVTETFDAGYWTGASAETLARLTAIKDLDETGSTFVSHNHKHLGAARITDLKANGVDVLCWTIKSPADEAEARKIAQNITFEGYRPAFPGA